MNLSNILFLSILGVTFTILAFCDYYRAVDIIYCKDQGRIIYANYTYFPLRKEYKAKYKCRVKRMKNYNFFKLKQIIVKNQKRN